MAKKNSIFNQQVLKVTTANTANVISTVSTLQFYKTRVRYNDLTEKYFNTASLPDNVDGYTKVRGGLMKVITINNISDLQKYLVATDNSLYDDIFEAINNAKSTLQKRIELWDMENVIATGDVPTFAPSLSSILERDKASITYTKLLLAEDKSLDDNWACMPIWGLGLGETVTSDDIKDVSPTLIGMQLNDGSGDPVLFSSLDGVTLGKLTSSKLKFTVQTTEIATFSPPTVELQKDGSSVKLSDVPAGDVTTIKESTLDATYTLKDNSTVVVNYVIDDLIKNTADTKTYFKLSTTDNLATKLANVDVTKPITIAYTPALPTTPAYTGVLEDEGYTYKNIIFYSPMKDVVTYTAGGTLLVAELPFGQEKIGTNVVTIIFESNLDDDYKIAFLSEADYTIEPSNSLYVAIAKAQIIIATEIEGILEEKGTYLNCPAVPLAEQKFFSDMYSSGLDLSEYIESACEGYPVELFRDYQFDAKLVSDYSVTPICFNRIGSVAPYFSLSIGNNLINFSYDMSFNGIIFTKTYRDTYGIPDSNSTDPNTFVENKPKLMQYVPELTDGVEYSFCSKSDTCYLIDGIYATMEELYIRAYADWLANTSYARTIVKEIRNSTPSVSLVNILNRTGNKIVSDLGTLFDDKIQNLVYNPVTYTTLQANPTFITTVDKGSRKTTFNGLNVASFNTLKAVGTYNITLSTEITGA